jgi:hypothetical protein
MKANREIIEKQFKSLDNFYHDLFQRHELAVESDLQKFELLVGQSWKWRIGSAVVNTFVRAMNLVSNPVKYFMDPDYRSSWKGMNTHAFPRVQISTSLYRDSAVLDKPRLMLPTEEETPSGNHENEKKIPLFAHPETEHRPAFAVILDAPLTQTLSSRFALYMLKPDSLTQQISDTSPDLLLCESARRGNGGAWQYKLSGTVQTEIQSLVTGFKAKSVPAVFWMTCSPEEAPDYFSTAGLFDIILSPDQQAEAFYPPDQKGKIRFFPFGVEPTINHPLSEKERTGKVCFPANFIDGHKATHPAKLVDFLSPAIKTGLDIYDIAHGEGEAWPASLTMLKQHVKGYLPSLKMAEKYREYMAMINVGMTDAEERYIPNWVFEALASGLPVISEEHQILRDVFGDAILYAGSGAEVARHLETLSKDQMFWMKQSVKGIRSVLKSHTMASRWRQLDDIPGFNPEPLQTPSVALMIDLSDDNGLEDIIAQINYQSVTPTAVAFFTSVVMEESELHWLQNRLPGMDVTSFLYFQHQLYQKVRDSLKTDYYAVWQRGCFYGNQYLEDYLLATWFSGKNVLCKRHHFQIREGALHEVYQGEHYCTASQAPLSSVMLSNEKLSGFNFLRMSENQATYHAFDEQMMSLDPLNYAFPNSPQDQENMFLAKELNI